MEKAAGSSPVTPTKGELKMWWRRLLNRLGFRSDEMVCIRQEDAWRWSSHLGERTEGKCTKCETPIYFEKQNKPFRKICNRCVATTTYLCEGELNGFTS